MRTDRRLVPEWALAIAAVVLLVSWPIPTALLFFRRVFGWLCAPWLLVGEWVCAERERHLEERRQRRARRAELELIRERIEAWIGADTDLDVAAWLGWTREEYAAFIEARHLERRS